MKLLKILGLAVLLLFAAMVVDGGAYGKPRSFDSHAAWDLEGSAQWDDDKLVLTKDEDNQMGFACCEIPFELEDDFEIEFQVYFGENDEKGGDGIVFFLTGDKIDMNSPSDMGFMFEEILIIGFETYPHERETWDYDFNDPDGDILIYGTMEMEEPEIVELDNIEDNEEHTFLISWDAEKESLSLYLDDLEDALMEIDDDEMDMFHDNRFFVNLIGVTLEGKNRQYVIPVVE